MSRPYCRLAVHASLVLLMAGPALAQTSSATIAGTVKDSSGSVLPGAQVTATNLGTGFTRTVTADAAGQYALQYLPLGTYRMEASAQGFKAFAQTGIVLELGRQARVDAVLQVGQVTERVEIVSDAPLVETGNPQVGRTVNQKEVLNLPLVNRNVYQLLTLTAGVDSNVYDDGDLGYPVQRVLINGGSNAGVGSVNFYLDGGNNVAGLRNSGNLAPNPDAVQEFRVVTNSYAAEYGRFAGGVVDIVTKSGTNELHGSAFEFHRDESFNARRWTPGASAINNPLDRDQFGGTLGGPVFKDRSFFFASYSGLRQRQPVYKNSAIVPTALERQGNFSQSARRPRDPLTGAAFPGDIIPASRIDPVATRIMADWIPLANLPDSRYEVQQIRPTDTNEMLLKLDHSAGKSHLLSASYFMSQGKDTQVLAGDLPWTERSFEWRQHNVNLGDTWTLNSSTINQTRLTYVRNFGGRVNRPFKSLADFGSRYILDGEPNLPRIGVTGFFNLQTAIQGPKAGSDYYALRDILTVNKGRHSVKLGFEGSLEKIIHDTQLDNYGRWVFDGARSGNAFADYLLGVPTTQAQDSPSIKTDNGWYAGLFVQDDFRVTRTLTLNVGVRYDIQFPYTDPQNRKLTYEAGARSQVAPNTLPGLLFPGDPGIPRGIVSPDTNNIAPRVGLAWDVSGDGKTAVRAAFGTFYGSISGNQWNGAADNQPFALRYTFSRQGSLSDPYSGQGGIAPVPFKYNAADPQFVLPARVSGIDRSFEWPYTYQMNVSVQREVVRDLSVTASYVGALGRKLPLDYDRNYPSWDPSARANNIDDRRPLTRQMGRIVFGQVREVNAIPSTDYHGLQLTAEKRGRVFSAKAFYTFSKSLEDLDLQGTSRPEGVPDPTIWPEFVSLQRGRTSNDRRHNFVLSAIWKTDYFKDDTRWVRALLDGWTVSTIVTLRSGEPFTVSTGTDNNFDGVTGDRPDIRGNPRLGAGRPRSEQVARWFDTTVFGAPSTRLFGPVGNSGRNIIDGPGTRRVDMALFRDFKLRSRFVLQIRAEATNAFNMVNLDGPNSSMNSANFGRILGADTMREIQLGARLSF
jgi:outer membrane receptor protein involved in Fe transport